MIRPWQQIHQKKKLWKKIKCSQFGEWQSNDEIEAVISKVWDDLTVGDVHSVFPELGRAISHGSLTEDYHNDVNSFHRLKRGWKLIRCVQWHGPSIVTKFLRTVSSSFGSFWSIDPDVSLGWLNENYRKLWKLSEPAKPNRSIGDAEKTESRIMNRHNENCVFRIMKLIDPARKDFNCAVPPFSWKSSSSNYSELWSHFTSSAPFAWSIWHSQLKSNRGLQFQITAIESGRYTTLFGRSDSSPS
jgi:hypothetical protein